ncbi:MAG TPA: glycosyltransferase, partial [Chitinophagaceae bacterium]|nr:glycosyltransferase [Chitinophagaceae bacterium]
SKIFLHPSNYEGFSSVCLEALAAGAHVVSFCQPMKEQIDHWHVVKDEEEMRGKVQMLLQDKNLDHSQVIYFTAKDAAQRILELFLH